MSPPMKGPVDKPADMVGAWKKLLGYLDRYRKIIYISILFSFIASLLTVIGPSKIQELTDEIVRQIVIAAKGGTFGMDAIVTITLILVAIYVASNIFQFIVNYALTRVSIKTSKNLRSDISKKINRVPLSYFDRSSTGDVLSRVSNDADTIGQSMSTSISTVVTSITMLIGSVVMMFWTNWKMALVAVIVSILGFALTAFVMSRSQKYFVIQQQNLGRMNGLVEENYSGHDIVKVYNGYGKSKKEFDEINEKLFHSAYKSQFLGGMMMPLMNLISNLGYVAVCIAGAVLMIKTHEISYGTIFAFMMYVRLFTQPLSQMAQAFLQMQSVAAASERVFEFLELEEMDPETDKIEELKDVKGSVEFCDVHFGYTPDKEIIHGFTARVEPGQKVAIVGPTGAGKTTLVNLLMRFYDVDSGEIRIDSIPTNKVRRENVHEQFCMVLQDTWIFEGTIKENIAYCMEGVTDEQIVEACKAVGIHHFIDSLPEKYDTKLSDKVTMSAGQRQQITIARAMVQKAPMVILDEATSSVDTRTEKIIQDAMDNLAKGRTSFVIAHRLSTIKNSDMIIVMKEGSIAEHGKHEELLQKGGFYAELYNSQFSEEAE